MIEAAKGLEALPEFPDPGRGWPDTDPERYGRLVPHLALATDALDL